MSDSATTLTKRATGIAGLDAVTHGGLPSHGAVLVMGGSGAGKTILGLQILAHGAARGEGGICACFEESREQILRDGASFTWGEHLQDTDHCTLIDARPHFGAASTGGFDIDGLLAVLDHCREQVNASWVVLDGIDQLLRLQGDAAAVRDQISRLADWSERQDLTLILTAKPAAPGENRVDSFEGIEYLLSTVFILSSQLVDQHLNRRFRIAKYRGTSHGLNELAMLMDNRGIHLPYGEVLAPGTAAASSERVSTGIARLDNVLDGGVHRGSTTLISGQPGTSKTTLGAAFAEAAASRGERVLFVSFDEFAPQIVRNVGSVGIDLQPHIDSGQLLLYASAAWMAPVEQHYLEMRQRIDEFRPECLVIDPASALLKASSSEHGFLAVERLLTLTRARGITTLITSLSEHDDPITESSLSHTSTLADTWIVLRYQVIGGERNRALSVVKSRGTAHSNQVREMLVSTDGIELADVYSYGSEVLMGTARLQKEAEEAERARRHEAEREQRRRDLERRIEQARGRIGEAQEEIDRLSAQLEHEQEKQVHADEQADRHRQSVLRRRKGDIHERARHFDNPSDNQGNQA